MILKTRKQANTFFFIKNRRDFSPVLRPLQNSLSPSFPSPSYHSRLPPIIPVSLLSFPPPSCHSRESGNPEEEADSLQTCQCSGVGGGSRRRLGCCSLADFTHHPPLPLKGGGIFFTIPQTQRPTTVYRPTRPVEDRF